MNGDQGQQQMYGEGYGFDPSQAGYGDVSWNNVSGFNPMMQVPMQNGTGGSWNNFSGMMGTPLLSVDDLYSYTNTLFQACRETSLFVLPVCQTSAGDVINTCCRNKERKNTRKAMPEAVQNSRCKCLRRKVWR